MGNSEETIADPMTSLSLISEEKSVMDILQAVGNTSMAQLGEVVPPSCADIY